ncbi:FAD/NAD(P)-binding protein [Chryseobacterium sp. PET-29]|uniref:FAD/NAD(P)-binding protein n=1 Tax=Chryseobacterium sp. PET-29 TaxID=2983267 RepID=UPI0021E58077|nr:FAD/NAD(P)-binding protein [Chryseobacterium sp. PET-29]
MMHQLLQNRSIDMEKIDSIGIVGGGPAALFVVKHLISEDIYPQTLYIFEKNTRIGAGMPYSQEGAAKEHVANVSANELPELPETFSSFIQRKPYPHHPDFSDYRNINEYKVIPRLILGDYLEEQFKILLNTARKKGVTVKVFTETTVIDIRKKDHLFEIITGGDDIYECSATIICTGHHWPKKFEGNKNGWYDSPYPPSKFSSPTNYPIAIRGTSLTAVDAIKTLARINGTFSEKDNEMTYTLHENSSNFSLTLFSKRGYLPALRFHSEGSAFSEGWIMSQEEIYEYKEKNGGFVDLNYVFERNFKQPLRKKNEKFYNEIKDLTIEQFVEKMLALREELDSFELFKAEYYEAQKSIERHQTIAWKETLSAFSYAINYPAKHFSAEDMIRMKKTLLPLISVIIASLPQSSYREIIALYNQGLISLVSVDDESHVEPHQEEGAIYHYTDHHSGEAKSDHYRMYVDAVGQQPVQFNDIPFETLREEGLISSGYLKFKDTSTGKMQFEEGNKKILKIEPENYYLRVDGLNINDYFQALDYYGRATQNLFIMTVPYIAGLNPDYSGLDFCDTAGKRVATCLKSGIIADQIVS